MGDHVKQFNKPGHIFPDRYYPTITNRKAAKGGFQGVLASGIGIGITALLKTVIDTDDPAVANAVSSISGVIAAGLTLGLTNWIGNKRKHGSKKRA